MEEKKYLSFEEVQTLFSSKNEEYEKNAQLSKMIDPLNKSFFTVIEHVQNNKVKVFQRKSSDKIHTFIEITEESLTDSEKDSLVKVANFLMKIEESLGYSKM